jgi:hypothetical protein
MTGVETHFLGSEPSDTLASGSGIRQTQPLEPDLRQSGGDLWIYRERTAGLLRRYFHVSVEVGRLPSLLGRELFRAKVSSYRAHTFEDAVIFVHDVEHCLEDLDEFDHRVLGKVVFQDYSQDEAAQLLGCGRKTVGRRVSEILDLVSERLLDRGLLHRLPAKTPGAAETCQEGKSGQFPASDCSAGKNNFRNRVHFPP